MDAGVALGPVAVADQEDALGGLMMRRATPASSNGLGHRSTPSGSGCGGSLRGCPQAVFLEDEVADRPRKAPLPGRRAALPAGSHGYSRRSCTASAAPAPQASLPAQWRRRRCRSRWPPGGGRSAFRRSPPRCPSWRR